MSMTRKKPEKPRKNFPLSPANNGQWCKKIKGRIHYFGVWADPAAAEAEYLRVREYLQAGRLPPTTVADDTSASIRELCDRFLFTKEKAVNSSELSIRTFHDYKSGCTEIADFFGRDRRIEDCRPEDFSAFRDKAGKTRGLHALGRMVTLTRMLFRFAYETELIEKPVRFGPRFEKPSKKSMRILRAKKQNEHGLKMFQADEIRRLHVSASETLKAMILLAINGGLGNTDLATLPKSAVQGDWLWFPRIKTGVDRRIPLWPETKEALSAAIEQRPKPQKTEDDGLCFITKYGHRWVRLGPSGRSNLDMITSEFNKLLVTLELKRSGLAFYALRHTFETIAGGCGDQVAVDAIMGHIDDGMAGLYREMIDDDRLLKASNHVRSWLFPDAR